MSYLLLYLALILAAVTIGIYGAIIWYAVACLAAYLRRKRILAELARVVRAELERRPSASSALKSSHS